MQIIKQIVITTFTFFYFLFVIVSIAHGSTKYYLVTEATTFNIGSPPGANAPVFKKNIFIDNKVGGRFVISSTPDGTGTVQIGDELIVSNINSFKTYSYIATSNCVNFNSVLPPTDITHIAMPGANNFNFVIRDRCARRQSVGNIYLVHLDIPGVDPFLDLPWDYENKGLTFTEAALSMSAYFDHEYPLLSSGTEGIDYVDTVIPYNDFKRTNKSYSSHDGYDWAKVARAEIGDPVLAAAKGDAIYVNNCGACGNMILIDHKNGFQTRYLHLQKDGLITNSPGIVVPVEQGQAIGKVGATGNVTPAGDLGAHIHFGVVQDKNKDGNFSDNIPDGMVDPFGWQSSSPDPWEKYTFTYNGQQKTGNKSHYLWIHPLNKLETSLSKSGGTFTNGKYTITFPQDALNQNATIKILPLPRINDGHKVSLSTTISIEVIAASGQLIKSFLKPYILEISFGDFDETKFIKETLSIYSSQDGENWQKENTTIDWVTNKASAQLNHLTQFALIAERRDMVPPVTQPILSGKKVADNKYRYPAQLELQAQDNDGGTGIDYTMYRLSGAEWEVYTGPLQYNVPGEYSIEYYSADNDENFEQLKTFEFTIVDNPPEAEIVFDIKNKELFIVGIDEGETLVTRKQLDSLIFETVITDKYESRITLKTKEEAKNKKLSVDFLSFQYDSEPETVLDSVQLNIDIKKKNNELKSFDQSLHIQNDDMKLSYNGNKDVTTMYVKDDEAKKVNYDGIKLLKLFTEKGTLKYKY